MPTAATNVIKRMPFRERRSKNPSRKRSVRSITELPLIDDRYSRGDEKWCTFAAKGSYSSQILRDARLSGSQALRLSGSQALAMKHPLSRGLTHNASSFILHPSAFILHPSSFPPAPLLAGISAGLKGFEPVPYPQVCQFVTVTLRGFATSGCEGAVPVVS